MLFIRTSLALALSATVYLTLHAQVRQERLLIPNTHLSLLPASDQFARKPNSAELRSTDGRSWLSFTIFTEDKLDHLDQSVMGTLPAGPRDTLWLLGGEVVVERTLDNRIADVPTYRYAASIRLKDGRYLGLAASVFTDGVISTAIMERTLLSLQWEERLAPIFYNTTFTFDPEILPLRHCRERHLPHPVVFTPEGHCDASGTNTTTITITDFGKRSRRRVSPVRIVLGIFFMRYDAGALQTEHGWWQRYIKQATATEPTIILYHHRSNTGEVLVQLTAPNEQLTIPLLDQFVATFKPQ